jgi:hypothetical protein
LLALAHITCGARQAQTLTAESQEAMDYDARALAVIRNGGAEVAIASIFAHASTVSQGGLICWSGLSLLSHLSMGRLDGWPSAAERQLALFNAGIYEALATAMRACRDLAKVQEYACVTLRQMGGNELEMYEAFLQSGCIPLLIAAMRTHLKEYQVQQNGCATVWNLAMLSHVSTACDPRYVHAVLESGGTAAAVAAMHAWPKSTTLQATAGGALLRILHSGGSRALQAVEEAKARAACVTALRLKSEEVNQAVQPVLSFLNDANREGYAAARSKSLDAGVFQETDRETLDRQSMEELVKMCDALHVNSAGAEKSELVGALCEATTKHHQRKALEATQVTKLMEGIFEHNRKQHGDECATQFQRVLSVAVHNSNLSFDDNSTSRAKVVGRAIEAADED